MTLTQDMQAAPQQSAEPASKPEAVAWYDPTNKDPGQSVTFDKSVRDAWPHLYPVALTRLDTSSKAEAGEVQPLEEWSYRWYGSPPYKGYTIIARRPGATRADDVAYLGDGEFIGAAVNKICDAHNAAIRAPVPAQPAPSEVVQEPTSEMLNRGADAMREGMVLLNSGRSYQSICKKIYEAMASAQPAAQVTADLQGLRSAILSPREILRDELGMLDHPALPFMDEDVDVALFAAAFGLEAVSVGMEHDADERLNDEYFQTGNCSAWTPTPPAGDGWQLITIFDTEDGPYATFMRQRVGPAAQVTDQAKDAQDVALWSALDRMDRARHVLTNGAPTPECNWGILDTADLRAAIAASKEAS